MRREEAKDLAWTKVRCKTNLELLTAEINGTLLFFTNLLQK